MQRLAIQFPAAKLSPCLTENFAVGEKSLMCEKKEKKEKYFAFDKLNVNS